MLRFIAACLFALEGGGQLSLAVSQTIFLLTADVEVSATERAVLASVLGGFWALGGLFTFSSAVIFFRSRSLRALMGGCWSLGVVLINCSCLGILGLGFLAIHFAQDWEEFGATQREAHILTLIGALIVSHLLLISLLGFLAIIWPLRRQPKLRPPADALAADA